MWQQQVSSLSEWYFTICLTPYTRKSNVLSVSLNKTFPFFLIKYTSVYLLLFLLVVVVLLILLF